MEFKLTKSQRRITHAAATNDIRPVLACVHIRRGIMEATDGRILVQKKVEYNGEEDILLNAKSLSAHKDNRSLDGVVYNTQGDGKLRGLGAEDYLLTPQEGKFPAVDTLFPSREPVFQIAFGRGVLKRLLDCIEEEEIKFYFYSSDGPAKISADSGETTGLIMPRLANWDEDTR